ncbi:MAG: PAS domain S-box protein [Armatimonadia bacterium]
MSEAKTTHADLVQKEFQLRRELAEVQQALGLSPSALPHCVAPTPTQTLMLEAVRQVMAASTLESLFEVTARAAQDLTGARVCLVKHEAQDYEASLLGDDSSPRGLVTRREGPEGEHWTALREWLGERRSVRYTQAELLAHPQIPGLPAEHPPLDGLAGAWIEDQKSRRAGLILVSGKDKGDFTAHDEQALVQLSEFVALRINNLQASADVEELALVAERQAAELDAVFSAVTEPIIVCDAEGVIRKVNPAVVLYLGYDPTGAPVAEFARKHSVLDENQNPIAPDDLIYSHALRGETVLAQHHVGVAPDGRIRHVLGSASPLRSSQGITGAVIVMHDTTQYYELLAAQEALVQDLRDSERSLAHSERLYRSIAELIPYGIWIADPRGIGTYVSKSFSDLVGKDPSEATVAERLALYAPEDQPSVLEAWEKMVSGAIDDLALEARVRGVDGKFHWILHRGAPVKDSSGHTTAWVGVNLGIDQFKQGEEEREQLLRDVQRERALFEAIVSQMPGSIVVALPPDGRLLYVNDKIQNLTIQPEASEGMGIQTSPWEASTLTGEPIPHEEWPIMTAITRGEATENLHVRVRSDGVERIISAYAQPVRDEQGTIIAGVMTFFDMTEQVQAENELQRYRQHLEDLVHERTNALQRMNDELLAKQDLLKRLDQQLVQAEERERETIALALHDSVAQTLAFAFLKAKLARSQVKDARGRQNLEDLASLVQQAILETRSLLTQLTPPVTSGATLRQSLDTLAEKMGTTYGYRTAVSGPVEPVTMSMDLKILLYRSARELLMNAAKHAQARHVWIDLAFEADSGCLTVNDDGVGFDPSAAHADYTGGFGLVSIQERLALLGGHLKVDSEMGHGATFQLCFPLESPPE